MSPITHIDRRLALRDSERYIIDPILPNGALHVITGPPDVGKSTWSFQLMNLWEQGKSVLGSCRSNPCEWVYVALDRSLRDADRTLRRIGLDHWNMPAYSIEEIIPRDSHKKIVSEPCIFEIHRKFPKAQLIFIEGLQMLLPNVARGQSLNKAHGMWVIRLRDEILNKGITIIAVNHTPKSSEAAHDREDMLGSQGLIGGLGTVIKFTLPPGSDGKSQGMLGASQTNSRLVSIMPKNSPPMYLTYSRGVNGTFELDAISNPSDVVDEAVKTDILITPGDLRRIMDMHLTAYEGLAELTAKQVMTWARSAGLTGEQTTSWIGEKLAGGILVREGRNYRRTSVQ